MRRWLSFLVLSSVPALVSVAHAQAPLPALPAGSGSAPSASATAPAASASAGATAAPVTGGRVDPAEWQARYDAAGRLMMGGDYMGALQVYSALAATAPSENARSLALEQLRVATEYAHRQQRPAPTGTTPAPTSTGPTTTLDSPPSELPPPPRRVHDPHARTTDELFFLYLATPVYGFTTGFWLDSLISKARATTSYGNDSPTIGAFFVGLGATGLSALAVAMLDGGKKLKYGAPQSITTGLAIGFGEGVGMAIWAGNRASDSKSSYVQFTSYLWGLSTVGIIAGSAVAATIPTTPGRSAWVGTTSLASGFVLGGLAGALTPPAINTYYGGYSSPDSSPSFRNLGITAAIGGLAGLGAGVLTAPLLSPSIARVRFIDLAWLSGGALSLGFCVAYASGNGCDDRVRFGVMSAGVGVGFLVGALATMGMKGDPLEDHVEGATPKEASFLDKVMPTMMPTQGGMTLGLAGQL